MRIIYTTLIACITLIWQLVHSQVYQSPYSAQEYGSNANRYHHNTVRRRLQMMSSQLGNSGSFVTVDLSDDPGGTPDEDLPTTDNSQDNQYSLYLLKAEVMYTLDIEKGYIPLLNFTSPALLPINSKIQWVFLEQEHKFEIITSATIDTKTVSCSLPERKYIMVSRSSTSNTQNSEYVMADILVRDKYRILTVTPRLTLKNGTAYTLESYSVKAYLEPSIKSHQQVDKVIRIVTNFDYTKAEVTDLLLWEHASSTYPVGVIISSPQYHNNNTVECDWSLFNIDEYNVVRLKYTLTHTVSTNIPIQPILTPIDPDTNAEPDYELFETTITGMFKAWEWIYTDASLMPTELSSGYQSQSLSKSICQSPLKITSPVVSATVNFSYNYKLDKLLFKSYELAPLNSLSISPDVITLPLESEIQIEIKSSDSFYLLKSLTYKRLEIYLENENITSSWWREDMQQSPFVYFSKLDTYYQFDTLFCSLHPQILLRIETAEGEVLLKAVDEDEISVQLYYGTFGLQVTQSQQEQEEENDQQSQLDELVLKDDGLYEIISVNNTNMFQSSAIVEDGYIIGNVNKEQYKTIIGDTYEISHWLFYGVTVEETELSIDSSIPYWIKCAFPSGPSFQIGPLDSISSIKIILKSKSGTKIKLTEFKNPIYETWEPPTFKLSPTSPKVLFSPYSQSVTQIQVLSGRITSFNTICIFQTNNTILSSIPSLPTTTTLNCPLPPLICQSPTCPISLSLLFTTPVLSQNMHIPISSEITVVTEPMQVSIASRLIQKILETNLSGAAPILNTEITFGMSDYKIDSQLSYQAFIDTFDSEHAWIQTNGTSKVNMTSLSITSIVTGSSGGIRLEHDWKESANKHSLTNETTFKLWYRSKDTESMLCSNDKLYSVSAPSVVKISPTLVTNEMLDSKFQITLDMSQIIEINTKDDDSKLALSIGARINIADEYHLQSIDYLILDNSRTIGERRDVIEFTIDPEILQYQNTYPLELELGLILSAIECTQCNSDIAYWDNTQLCPTTDVSTHKSKIFLSCRSSVTNCKADFIDLNVLQDLKDAYVIDFNITQSGIALVLDASITIIEPVLVTSYSPKIIYTYSDAGVYPHQNEFRFKLNSLHSFVQENIVMPLCKQTFSNNSEILHHPIATQSDSIICPIKFDKTFITTDISLFYGESLLDPTQFELSSPVSVNIIHFEITKFTPLLSWKSGGGKWTVYGNFKRLLSLNLGWKYGSTHIFPTLTATSSQIQWQIPPWSKASNVSVELVSLDSAVEIIGTPFPLQYWDITDCTSSSLAVLEADSDWYKSVNITQYWDPDLTESSETSSDSTSPSGSTQVYNNAELISLEPRTLWTIASMENTTTLNMDYYLPIVFEIKVNKYSPLEEQLYCVIYDPKSSDSSGILHTLEVKVLDGKIFCEITAAEDIVTSFINEEFYFYVTKDLSRINIQQDFSILTRPIPEIISISLDDLEVGNYSLSAINSANITLSGINFAKDTLPLAILPYTDSLGRNLLFDGADARYIYKDKFKMTIEDPLAFENLLTVRRITQVIPSFTSITLDASNSATIDQSSIQIIFDVAIPKTENIKIFLLHYLQESYELSVISYNYNTNKNNFIDSVSVEIPVIPSPMQMEVYIQPILEHRIVFEKGKFEYKFAEEFVDTFLQNNTVIEPVLPPNTKIIKVLPVIVESTDTKLHIEGEELSENIQCIYQASASTESITLLNSTYGYCPLTWSNALTSEIVLISNGTNLHQLTISYLDNTYYYIENSEYFDPSRNLAWCMIDDYRALYGLISENEASCSITLGNTLYSFPVDASFLNDTYNALTFTHVEPNVIRDAQQFEITHVFIYGVGILEEFTDKLEWHFETSNNYLEVTQASIVSENNIKCEIPYNVYQFGVYTSQNFGYFTVSVKHQDKTSIIENSTFKVFINSVIRLISHAHVLYFDTNNQYVQVELEDSSSLFSLETATNTYVTREYTCTFINDLDEILLTTALDQKSIFERNSKADYSDIKYYDIFCPFPNIDSSIIPTQMYVAENYKIGDIEYDYTSTEIPIIVETQPIISNILPSNHYQKSTTGTITIEGTFDSSRTLYLRMTFEDNLEETVIASTTVSTTQAIFNIEKSYVPTAGTYNLEVSYYSDLFCSYLPLNKYKWGFTKVDESWITANLYVVTIPTILEAFPLSLPANTTGQMLTLFGKNFTEYTLCEIDGSIITTTRVNEDIIRCEIPEGIFGTTKAFKLNERGIFSIDATSLSITYTAPITITGIEPSVIFKNVFSSLESSNENIKVFVADFPNFSGRVDCKFNNVILQSIGTNQDVNGNKYIICPLPLFPNSDSSHTEGTKSIVVEIVSWNDVIYTSNTVADHTLMFVDVPVITSVTPRYFPRYIEYPPDQEIQDSHKIVVEGVNFDSTLAYYCVFKYGLSSSKEIIAEYIDSTSIRCRPIDFDYEAYLDVEVKAVKNDIYSYGYGSINVFLYEIPMIQNVMPISSAIDEEAEFSINVDQLPYIQNVLCKFGTNSASQVTIYRQGRQVICKAPILSAQFVSIQISVDGVHWYSSEQSITFFQTPTFTGVDSTLIPLKGREYIVVSGTNFYNSGKYLSCRLQITSTEYFDMKVDYISDTELRCLKPPSYVKEVTGMTLSVSFNTLKLYSVTSSLEYTSGDRFSVYSSDKFYGNQNPSANTITITGQSFINATLVSVGGFSNTLPFTVLNDNSGTFELPPFVNISSITGNPYTYQWSFGEDQDIGKYCTDSYKTGESAWWFLQGTTSQLVSFLVTKDITGWICIDRYPRSTIEVGIPEIGFSDNGVSYQYFPPPSLSSSEPSAIYKDTETELLVKGSGFWYTDTLKCRVRVNTNTFMYLATTFVNTTAIKCVFPSTSDTGSTYSLGVTLNGYEYIDQSGELNLSVNDPIVIYSVFPVVMFKSQRDVEILVRAAPLPDNSVLECIVHEFIIQGEKYVDGANTYVKCTIPSYEAVANSAVNPIPTNGEVEVNIGTHGVVFGTDGVIFKFLDANQVNGISPLNGPATGGTVITINLYIDQTVGDIGDVYWLFYNTETVVAVASPPYDYLCAAPVLDTSVCDSTYDWSPIFDSDNIENKELTLYPDYAISKVDVLIAGEADREFQFTYNRGIEITGFEPPYGLYDEAKTLIIKGNNFHPHINIKWKYTLGSATEVTALYVTNKTVSCDIPALSNAYTLPYYLNIELTFNNGHDYTASGAQYAYCKKSMVNTMSPVKGPVTGSTILQLSYGTPGSQTGWLDILDIDINADLTSSRIRWVFEQENDPTYTFATMVISHDTVNNILTCFTPSANLVDSVGGTLFSNGGNIKVSVSGTDEQFLFTYEPVPKITNISPTFIFSEDTGIIITIAGLNFFTDTLAYTKVVLSSQDKSITLTPSSVTNTSLSVTLNENFPPRTRVEVSLTFNGDDYYIAPNFISVSKRFSLDKLSQEIISSAADNILIHIQEDVEAEGGIWDTQNNMKCSYNNGAYIEQATYISSTLVSCKLPSITLTTLTVKVIIDESNSFESTNELTITFVSTPTINSIADTGIFLQMNGARAILYAPELERIATITGSGFMNGPNNIVHAYFPSGEVLEIEATSDTEIQLPLPVTDPSVTIDKVYLSVDKNYFVAHTLTNPINVEAWPEGNYWEGTAITQCVAGEFWPLNQLNWPLLWGPGYTQSTAGATKCDACSDGTDSKFCPFSGGTPLDWPQGYFCTNTTDRIYYDLESCPAGFVWDSSTTDRNISSNIGGSGKPKACPNGMWWGEAVHTIQHRSGDYQTPQICKDGVICGQTVDGTTTTTDAGSKNPFGSFLWPISKYCEQGLQLSCPAGSFCSEVGMDHPDYCPAGYFSTTDQSSCQKWPIGTFCSYLGVTNPIKCSQGNVCQLDSQLGITQLWPAGSYCVSKTVTTRTNTTVIEESYIPIYCKAGTYCLSGVYTPIVDPLNPQAAQDCIEGSYCIEGTDSPRGIACPEGHYCPKESQLPIPTEPGYFANGTGNVQQEPCPPGMYSNTSQVSLWSIWPAGYEWTQEATIVPTLCKAGTYKEENENLIYCELWPQGTWSNQTGLTKQDDCTPCEPKIVCIYEGMTSLDQAIDWPEGYVWPKSRTTSFTMFSNPCPEGYYWGTRTSEESDYKFCDRGLYCPVASTSTGRTQNKWLSGYFCPLGTAASLNALGTFETVYQLAAARALEGTAQYPACDEDSQLPQDLIDLYINNGIQLKWPEGTTSSRGSWWLGQCQIETTSIVETFNPVNGSWSVTGEKDVLGENTSFTGRNLASDPLNTPLYEYTIEPLRSAKIYMDFSELPSGFVYNEHFLISIQDGDGNELTLPTYFSTSNSIASKHKHLQIRVHNMQDKDQKFKFGIYLLHGLFSPYQAYLRNKVSVYLYQAQRAVIGDAVTFGFLISETFLSGITIPYNAPDVENDQSFFLDMTEDVGLLPTRGYDKDVYDTTYWQSRQITSAIMSWVPFFSNCAGYDSKIIFYDVVEGNSKCNLPTVGETIVVDPIPISGLSPTADRCSLELQCRFDEVLDSSVSSSSRWYEIQEAQTLFLVTRDPIGPGTFFSKGGDSDLETGFTNDISDGDDSLIEAEIKPLVSSGFPTKVTLKVLYYQRSLTEKRIVIVNILLDDYKQFETHEEAKYTLTIEYRAMTFFELINNFQFSIFIYILLFTMITIVLFICVLLVWIVHLIIVRRKKPPVIKFMHMARVTFGPPTIGSVLATIPIIWSAGLLKLTQDISFLDSFVAEWKNQGEEISETEATLDKRGRLGLQFVIIGFICLFYGANVMIIKPSMQEEKNIIEKQKNQRINERIDDSLDGSQSSLYNHGGKPLEEDEREQDIKIRSALTWKRKHFIIMCMVITLLLLIKLEFSYTKTFSENIYTFLIIFMILDIIFEQLLNRVIMSESLLVSPILGAFVITEFIMTMGAEDFQNFIISYFIETGLVVTGRIYIGPAVEKIEFYTQRFAIWLSLKFKFAEKLFRKILRKQLLIQTQLQNLSEFHHFNRNRQKETGEGMEGLLGSVSSYASQVQALFITPVVLIFIIFFAQETKIPQSYSIRKSDLNYYMMFSIILIFPQLVINIFLLHILEILHGFKIYDYLTYCDFKFKNRSTKWINQQPLDKSILHSYRSLDNMSFSSQFYFIITLVTWGIIILDLGLITMIENKYNPFADPLLAVYVIIILIATVIIKLVFNTIAGYFKLWTLNSRNDQLKLDVRAITILDKEHDMRRLLNLIYNHHGFRHKFIRVNRAWVIENLAKVLNRDYVMKDDDKFLLNVYQEAVNADAVEERLKKEQAKIQKDLAVMPYNRKDQDVVEVSDDSITDIPLYNWKVPDTMETIPKIKKLARTWLKFARQNMYLKEMVVDIVMDKCASRWSRCKSNFRLQVIQEHPFYVIADQFNRRMKGIPFTKKIFRKYYAQHQVFTTLCMECAYIKSNNPDKADFLFQTRQKK